ncbi:MAG: hypothetical protein LBE97_00265 [Holosporales bacterium]|nr:hypothetical protein [Holosporales bacterium]
MLGNQTKNTKTEKKSQTYLSVSGIFYIDQDNWTVWINDIPYSKVGQYLDFSIDEISESEILLTLNNSETVVLSVTVK